MVLAASTFHVFVTNRRTKLDFPTPYLRERKKERKKERKREKKEEKNINKKYQTR